MIQWLVDNQDAIAVAIIVLMVLAGDAGTSEAVTLVGLPDLAGSARSFAGLVSGVVGHRQGAPMRAILSAAREDACLAPPGPV